MTPGSAGLLIIAIALAGCGSDKVSVPDNSRNGPVNAVAAERAAGFRVRVLVDGRVTQPQRVEDQARDGRTCRVVRQVPRHGLLRKGGRVEIDIRCG